MRATHHQAQSIRGALGGARGFSSNFPSGAAGVWPLDCLPRLLAILCALFALPSPLPAQPEADPVDGPTAQQMMHNVEESPRGADLTARATWRLIAANGRERTRLTRFFRLELDGDPELRARWLLVFDSPRDVKDTALLVWNPREPASPPAQWMYLAGYRKVKRVVSGSRGDAFLGTDFSFEDLSERLADEDTHVLLRTEELDSVLHHVIESQPREQAPVYSKRIQWVDPSSWTISRIEFYGHDGRLRKTLRSQWSQVKGAWVATRLEMASLVDGHRTVIEVQDVDVDSGLDPDLFTTAHLDRAGR